MYVRQWGGYHIHDQGEMCFERSTVSHDFSVKRCEKYIVYIQYISRGHRAVQDPADDCYNWTSI